MINIPTLSALYTGIINDLTTEFGVYINPLGKAVLRALAAVQAGKLKIYYLVIAALQKNVAPDTCDEETLLRFGMIKLGRAPFAAVAAQYELEITGTVGAIIPAQTTFKSDDDSLNPEILFILDTAYTLTASTDYITVRCLTTGEDGELALLDTLTPTAPIPLVDSGPGSAFVNSEVVQPLAAETTEAYRAVVIQAYRLEPQGGAGTDYRLWAADAQGVAKVYPYATSNAQAQINLYVEATIADSVDGKGTPSAQTLLDVEDVINFSPDPTLPLDQNGRRPLNVTVNYLACNPLDIDITIPNFQDNTAAKQALILAALTERLSTIRPFIASADILANQDDTLNGNVLAAAIIEAVPGAIFGGVTFTVASVSQTTYTFMNGEITYLNSITYT